MSIALILFVICTVGFFAAIAPRDESVANRLGALVILVIICLAVGWGVA